MGSSRWLIFFILPVLLVLDLLAPTIVGHHTTGACTDKADYCWSCVDNGGMQTTNNASNNGGIYRQNLNTLLSSFPSDPQINPRFYSSSLGQAPDTVNAIAVCRGDVALEDCRACFKNSVPILLQYCADQKKGIIWAERCTVQYSNISISGVLKDEPVKFVDSPNKISNAEEYKQVRDPLFENLSEKAAAGDSDLKFAAGNASVPGTNETIYAAVQCSPDLDKQNCSDCLKKSIPNITECCGTVGGGRVLKPSCYLRFESNPFLVLAPLVPTIVGDHSTSGVCTMRAEYCWSCFNTKNTNNGSIYNQNLNNLLSSFPSNPKINPRFYSSSLGQAPDKVNAIAVCRGDVALKDCRTCFKDSVSILLQNCTNQKEAIIWAERCTVRYSNISIFGVLEYEPVKFVPSPNNISNAEQYKQVRDPLFGNLSEKAAAGNSVLKFAAGNALVPLTNQTIYATAQCSPDLNKQNCSDCLKKSIPNMIECCGGVGGGRVLRPSCYLRFESNPF